VVTSALGFLVRTIGRITAFGGFSLIVAPALLAINGLLDNATFTTLFVIGFVLIIVSSSNRARSAQQKRKLD
jgi:uncharacterized membrane protein YfcA